MTVNLPEKYLKAIELLVGEDKLHASRSELIRVALRDFFLEEIKITKELQRERIEIIKKTLDDLDDEEYVHIRSEENKMKKHKIIREA